MLLSNHWVHFTDGILVLNILNNKQLSLCSLVFGKYSENVAAGRRGNNKLYFDWFKFHVLLSKSFCWMGLMTYYFLVIWFISWGLPEKINVNGFPKLIYKNATGDRLEEKDLVVRSNMSRSISSTKMVY